MESLCQTDWHGKKYAFFSHKECEAFPCHPGIASDNFNCLFCYCPLYMLGDQCGGNFAYLDNGVKDCHACIIPHDKDKYGIIVEHLRVFLDQQKQSIQRGAANGRKQ